MYSWLWLQVLKLFLVLAVLSVGRIPDALDLISKTQFSLPHVLEIILHGKLVPKDPDTLPNSPFPAQPLKDPVRGNIVFENVTFSYPTRPDLKVLENVNFSVEHGKCIAVVGYTGSGKTSVLSLIERFYDLKCMVCSLINKVGLMLFQWEELCLIAEIFVGFKEYLCAK